MSTPSLTVTPSLTLIQSHFINELSTQSPMHHARTFSFAHSISDLSALCAFISFDDCPGITIKALFFLFISKLYFIFKNIPLGDNLPTVADFNSRKMKHCFQEYVFIFLLICFGTKLIRKNLWFRSQLLKENYFSIFLSVFRILIRMT